MDKIDTSKRVILTKKVIEDLINNFNTVLSNRGLSNNTISPPPPSIHDFVKKDLIETLKAKEAIIKTSSSTYGTCSTVKSYTFLNTSTPDVSQKTCIEVSDINELISDVNSLLSQCSCNTNVQTSKNGKTVCNNCIHCSNSVCDCQSNYITVSCSTHYTTTTVYCSSHCFCNKVCTECDDAAWVDCSVETVDCDCHEEGTGTCGCNLVQNYCACEAATTTVCKSDGCVCESTSELVDCASYKETKDTHSGTYCKCNTVKTASYQENNPTTKCSCDGNACSCNDDCSCNQVCNCNWV